MGRRPQNVRCSYFHQWKKESLSGPRRICSQRGAQASVVVQRRNRLVRIQWEVPAAPPAGDYYPTPQAITEQEFENHVRQQEKKEQTQPSADGQQPPATAGETPDEASPAADGKTDKASAA